MKFREWKNSKQKNYFELEVGDIMVLSSNRKFSFVRIKRGAQSMVGTSVEDGKNFSIRITDYYSKKITVIGKEIKKNTLVNDSNKLNMKDLKLKEFVVIMTGRNNTTPELAQLVEIKPTNKYSHVFKNPITRRKTSYNQNDNWEIHRINDILKK